MAKTFFFSASLPNITGGGRFCPLLKQKDQELKGLFEARIGHVRLTNDNFSEKILTFAKNRPGICILERKENLDLVDGSTQPETQPFICTLFVLCTAL